MSLEDLEIQFEEAVSLKDVSPSKSILVFKRIIAADIDGQSGQRVSVEEEERWTSLKERVIYLLAEQYSASGSVSDLESLLVDIRPFFGRISKAKSGKMMRSLLSKVGAVSAADGDHSVVIRVCAECISWCRSEGRTFLRQQMESKLASYYLLAAEYQSALKLMNRLLAEVKALDDKHLLVELHLMESSLHHNLKNVAKAKAALTACRAAANSIYIGPLLQAEMDEQAGSIASEERDYKTAYSYFYEAFEGFDGLKDERAPRVLQYMLLIKILNDEPGDVKAVMAGKLALKYQSAAIQMMADIATSYSKRDLAAFERIAGAEENASTLRDIVISNKLEELKNKLLEQNLLRLLEPFERVEIDHIANLMQLPTDGVQKKLSQMILDKKLHGILDQGSGAIIVFDDVPESDVYGNAVSTIDELNDAVDLLFEKANVLD